MALKTAWGQALRQSVEERSIWFCVCLFFFFFKTTGAYLYPAFPQKTSLAASVQAFGQPGQVAEWQWPAAASRCGGGLHRGSTGCVRLKALGP